MLNTDKIIYDFLFEIFEKLGYLVKEVDFFDNELDGFGMSGRMFDKKLILLDSRSSYMVKNRFLIGELKKIDTENIFIYPIIRKLIEED